MKEGLKVLEISLACAVRPVHLNEFHVALGALLVITLPGCLISFLTLSSSALHHTLVRTFGGMAVYDGRTSRSAWWV